MDICSISKKLKNGNNDDSHDCNRSLNDFHDAILKHILSFLPTNLAVQTSVLSRRWEYMWTSLSDLVFQEDPYGREIKSFKNFVDRALILHNVSSIRKFSLECHAEDDVSRINAWISGVVKRNAIEIDIFFRESPEFGFIHESLQHVLPFCLFSSETIQVLRLHIYTFFQLPSQFCLPRLKTLTLGGFTFKNNHPLNILFASPALEQLVLDDCAWQGDGTEFVISAPNLLMLTINEVIETWSDHLASISITISAPELKNFSYEGGFFKYYCFPSSPSIIEASLSSHEIMLEFELNPDHLDEVLRSLQLVAYLQLSASMVWAFSQANTVPIFNNLTVLELDGHQDNWDELELVINKCPCLESLKFREGINLDINDNNFDRLLNFNLIYLPSTLKQIVIEDFTGNIIEISFVQILLAKLTSLNTMKIYFGMNADIIVKNEIETLLSALPRGSKSCKLKLRWS